MLLVQRGVCAATVMIPLQAVLGVEVFQACNKADAACFDDAPDRFAGKLAVLYQRTYSRVRESQAGAKREYDTRVNLVEFETGSGMLIWSIKMS